MATLEQRLRALEQRRRSLSVGDAPCEVTDDELAGVIQLMRDRGEWERDENSLAFVAGMTDAELSAILMPLVEEWRAAHGYA